MEIELPRGPGTYVLELHLAAARTIVVGRLGQMPCAEGWYYYAGSALGGLRGRLLRHLRTEKARHWHIDTLREHASITSIYTLEDPARRECEVASLLASLPQAGLPMPRFGASDCHCRTHLIWLRSKPQLDLGPRWQHHLVHRA